MIRSAETLGAVGTGPGKGFDRAVLFPRELGARRRIRLKTERGTIARAELAAFVLNARARIARHPPRGGVNMHRVTVRRAATGQITYAFGRTARMGLDERLVSDRFPRTSAYHPEWVLGGVSGGANPLWLAEWLTEALDLRPGMRVPELGCRRARSSVVLRREFADQVWAADLWFSPSENLWRVRNVGVADGVFVVRADARSWG